MIVLNRPIALKPFKDYKNQPEKYQEKFIGSMKRFGEYQQFQVHDTNESKNGRVTFGFFYIQIYGCEIDLKPGDMVTIDRILYLQNKSKLAIIGCTIKEKSPFQLDSELKERLDQEENDDYIGF